VGFLDSDWLKEDCSGGFQVLPAWQGYNVGEREHHNFNFTSDHFDLKNTYPEEAIWQKNYPFCGGHNNLGDKRWAIRKIGIDFGVYKYEKDWGNCAGEVEGKWYYVDGNRELGFWPNAVGDSP
jgi:hypothetical protein